MPDVEVYVFSAVSAILLISALATVMAKSLFRAALGLAGALVSVAVVFLTLEAEFLFVVQILVYVGAVVTLILFAIMFTHGSTQEEP